MLASKCRRSSVCVSVSSINYFKCMSSLKKPLARDLAVKVGLGRGYGRVKDLKVALHVVIDVHDGGNVAL